jgi:hypothetical protein
VKLAQEVRNEEAGLARDRRRLAFAHLSMGGAAMTIYWLRPATSHPMHAMGIGFPSWLAVSTIVAWSPYLVSWLVARGILPGNPRAVITFIVLASITTIVAAPFYLNMYGLGQVMTPIMVAASVTMLLVATAYVCVGIARITD